jgi:anthranilate 1,2-dioxygenase small subunit
MGQWMNPGDFSEVELQFHVERLQTRYVECIDDDRLEQWPEFFSDSCLYKIISRENADRDMPIAAIFCDSIGMLQDRVVALRKANIYAPHFYRHLISNVHIKRVEDRVVEVQSNYVVLQTLMNGDTHIYNAGKYLDQIVFEESGPRFRQKVVVFDTYRIANLMVTPI